MSNCKVSLIMAVYNGGDYLRLCLESIRNQTYTNFEVIMVDDGSSDDSGKICDDFERTDDRFKVVHQSNKGCSVARNNGLLIATGEYIGIVDQDDYLHEEYISYFMGLIEKNHVEIATSDTIKNFIGNPPDSIPLCNDNIRLWSGDDTAKAMLLYTLQIGPWNKLIKKSLIDNHEIQFQENFYCGEGFAFSIECFQAAKKVAVGHENLYYYRIDNATSGSSTFSVKKYRSSLKAQEYMRSVLNDKSEYADKVLKFSKWKTISDYYTLLEVSGVKREYQKEYNEMRANYRKNAHYVFSLPTTLKQKIRTSIFIFCPSLAVRLLKIRINRTTGGKFKE